GLAAGLCGVSLVLQNRAAKADAEPGLELYAIACVVMGGVRVTGGAGHVAGTLLGAVTVATLLYGALSVDAAWRHTLIRAALVAVALVNEASARWAARRATSFLTP